MQRELDEVLLLAGLLRFHDSIDVAFFTHFCKYVEFLKHFCCKKYTFFSELQLTSVLNFQLNILHF